MVKIIAIEHDAKKCISIITLENGEKAVLPDNTIENDFYVMTNYISKTKDLEIDELKAINKKLNFELKRCDAIIESIFKDIYFINSVIFKMREKFDEYNKYKEKREDEC